MQFVPVQPSLHVKQSPFCTLHITSLQLLGQVLLQKLPYFLVFDNLFKKSSYKHGCDKLQIFISISHRRQIAAQQDKQTDRQTYRPTAIQKDRYPYMQASWKIDR